MNIPQIAPEKALRPRSYSSDELPEKRRERSSSVDENFRGGWNNGQNGVKFLNRIPKSELNAQIMELKAALQQRDQYIDGLNWQWQAEVDLKDRQVAQLWNQCADQTADFGIRLGKTQQAVRDLNGQVALQDQYIGQLDAAYQAMEYKADLHGQQAKEAQKQLGERNVELAAAKNEIADPSVSTQFRVFNSVMRPIMGFAGAAICVYAALNNTAMIAEGVDLLFRTVSIPMTFEGLSGPLMNLELEAVLALIAPVAYQISALVGPAALYPMLKLVNFVKDLIWNVSIGALKFGFNLTVETLKFGGKLTIATVKAACKLMIGTLKFACNLMIGIMKVVKYLTVGSAKVVYTILKTIVNVCVSILKKVYEYRTALLALTAIGMYMYYNPAANAMIAPYYNEALKVAMKNYEWILEVVSPYYNEIADQAPLYIADMQDWAADNVPSVMDSAVVVKAIKLASDLKEIALNNMPGFATQQTISA